LWGQSSCNQCSMQEPRSKTKGLVPYSAKEACQTGRALFMDKTMITPGVEPGIS
jgi:hypothetical protein